MEMRLKLSLIVIFIIINLTAPVMAAGETPGTEAPDLFNAGIKTMSYLVLLIGVLLVALYFLRKITVNRNGIMRGQDTIRVIATRHLAPKNYITVVEVGNSVLTLGVTSENISCLDKTSSESFLKKNPETPEQDIKGSFASRLKALTSQGPKS